MSVFSRIKEVLAGEEDHFEGKEEKKQRAMEVLGEETRKEHKKKAKKEAKKGYKGLLDRKAEVLDSLEDWDEEVERKFSHPDVFRLTGLQLRSLLKEKGYKWLDADLRMDLVNDHLDLFENELKKVYGQATDTHDLIEKFGEETLREGIADATEEDIDLGEISNRRLEDYFGAPEDERDDYLEGFKQDLQETEEEAA